MSASDKDGDSHPSHSVSPENQQSSPKASDTPMNGVSPQVEDSVFERSDQVVDENLNSTSSQEIIMSPTDLDTATDITKNVSSLKNPSTSPLEVLHLDDSMAEIVTEQGTDSINLRGNEHTRKKLIREERIEKPEELSNKVGQLPLDEEKETAEDDIDHKPLEETESSDEIDARSTLKRRKSTFLSDDDLKDDSLEQYKIEIPLKKKVNQSTKKKLWREIERRKPFITQNVAEHIQKFAKPPFVTWGCKNCEYSSEA